MRPVHVALIALAALAVGVVSGYFLGAESAPPPNHWSVESQAQAAELPARVETGAAVEPVDSGTASRIEKDSPESAPARRRALDELVRAMADEPPKPGVGRITGRVTTSDGKPVAGAAVSAWPQNPDENPWAADLSMEEKLERYFRSTHFSERGKVSARTDADGRYALGNLGDYRYSVRATADGYECTAAGGAAWNVEPDAEVNFSAQPACVLDFDIRLPDGTQPKSADITLRWGNGESRQYWTPNRPRPSQRPGQYRMQVTAGKAEEFASETFDIKLRQGDPPLKMTIQLEAASGISCDIRYPPGIANIEEVYGHGSDVRVLLVPDPPAEPPAETDYGYEGVSMWRGSRLSFLSLDPGRYRLVAHVRNRLLAWQDVTLGNELLKVTLQVPEPDPADFFVVRVYGADGALIRDAQVKYRAPGMADERGNVIRHDDGSFRLRRGANVRGGYDVTASSETLGQLTVRYEANATHDLEIRFGQPARLTVLLPGVSAHRLRERLVARLMLEQSDGRWNGMPPKGGYQEAEGLKSDKLEYEPIAAGRYRFYLALKGNSVGVLAEVLFEVATGTETIQTCLLPELYSLTVILPDGKKPGLLYVRSSDGKSSRSVAGNDIRQRTVIDGLTAGDWVIVTDTGEMPVRITGETQVVLAERPFDCLRISGLKPGGRLEALGLRNGDLLIGVDGEPFASLSTLRTQASFSYTKDNTTWSVIRNGATLSITFAGRQVAEIAAMTGTDREYIELSNAVRE
jgi:hypothetical protein